MMWLFDERQATPWVIVIGVIAVALLAVSWAKTGRKEILYALGVCLLLFGGLLVLQRVINTDSEELFATLNTIAGDVERNDLKAVLGHIHSQSSQVRKDAEDEFPKYRFKTVDITRIREIRLEPKHVPPQAVIEFSVIVTGSDAAGELNDQKVPRFVIAIFRKEEGRWRLHHYEHHDPQQAIMK